MKLTNKWIAEGMYVTNGKQVWKVIDWDSKYRDALLQKIDKNGNKTDYFVVAENYELYGDENEALISWMNGDYLDDISQSDAEEYFDDFYKNGKVKESLTESIDTNYVIKNANFDGITFTNDDKIISNIGFTGNFSKAKKVALDYADKYFSGFFTCAWGRLYYHIEDGKLIVNEFKNRGEYDPKKAIKNITESAKPIDEKNVAKFVDELNEWVDDNFNYSDAEQARFTKQYGKIYDFKYDWDYSYGDRGDLLVWDESGNLNWFEDDSVKNFIVKLAKKYGWYCEPCHSSSDFMFAEL